MKQKWHSLENLNETESNEITAEATFSPDSSWFEGHFPGFPLLPGIAELAIVCEMLKKDAIKKNRKIFISEISRVRFRQFVRPNDTVQVISKQDQHDPYRYKFKVLVKGQIACNGLMTTSVTHDTEYQGTR
jgi:3-hydroxyacyl-[acyl-carrier-protein] dehydratase